MSLSVMKRPLEAGAGATSRVCRTAAVLLVATCLVAATGTYSSRSAPDGTPGADRAASPVASPSASAIAIDPGPSTRIIVGEITIHVTDEAIIPAHFESAVGRDVTIHVVNQGTRPHTFTIEELAVDIELAPGESATIEIDQPPLGTYRYFSALPGDEDLEGTMTIFI